MTCLRLAGDGPEHTPTDALPYQQQATQDGIKLLALRERSRGGPGKGLVVDSTLAPYCTVIYRLYYVA